MSGFMGPAAALGFADDEDVPNREITLSSGETEILHPVIARWRNRVKAREAEIRAIYAIEPGIRCVFCEDAGYAVKRSDPAHHNENPGHPCLCNIGHSIGLTEKREQDWRRIVPERQRDWTIESCPNEELVADIYVFLRRDPLKTGTGMVLIGDVGRGKTGAAVGLLRYYHGCGHSVAIHNVQELLDQIKTDFDAKGTPEHQRTMARACAVKVLLLDDLGMERVTEWSAQVIDQIIRKRYDEYRPTFITSNLSGSAFERHIGERLVSRIQESAVVITADGPDFRPPDPTSLDDFRRKELL